MVLFFQKAIKFVVLPLFLAFVAFLGEVRAKPPDVVVVDKDTDKPYPFDILKANTWQPVEKGLQFLRMSETVMRDRGEGENQKLPVTVDFDILKFDPAYFDFSVYGAVTDKTESKALLAWLQQYDLTAVINSSMYLTDGKPVSAICGKMTFITIIISEKVWERFSFLALMKNIREKFLPVLSFTIMTRIWTLTFRKRKKKGPLKMR